jgi:hypothetical protein
VTGHGFAAILWTRRSVPGVHEGRATKRAVSIRLIALGGSNHVMISEFASLAFRGGIAVALLIVALQFSGLFH